MELRSARLTALTTLATLLFSAAAVNANSQLDGNEDFVPIASRGFEKVVTNASGGVFSGAPATWDGVPNLVDNPVPPNISHRKNSYPWGMAWYDGRLFVGTNRDVGCAFYGGNPIVEPCADGPNGLPGPGQRAEIWAYDPAGNHGLSGDWSRVYQSPSLTSFFARILGFGSVPRDFGYRNLMACDAGGTERLYAISFGAPGRVLYYNGSSFSQASMSGLNNSLFGIQSGSTDLGYRAMACYKGRLFISPLGEFTDPDTTPRPILFANRNPATGGSWQNVVNVKTDPAMGNPNNVAIFQMTVHEDWLYLSVGNRTDGFEVWRTDGAGCEASDATCNMSWEKIIVAGAGRPADSFGPAVDNALAGAVSFDGYLYMAAAESGFSELTTSEVFRWDADAEVFELVAGFPREIDNMPANYYCPDPIDFFGTLYCQPTSGRGPGLGEDSLSYGSASYFWRAVEHEGSLFVGTLDVFNDPEEEEGGFDLYKVDHADGGDTINISSVTLDGLGNGLNYGVRNMFSIPANGFAPGSSPMLAVGAANVYTNAPGGLEVHIGTIDPATPPIAATDETLFETDLAKIGQIEVTLTGEKSVNPFGGSSADLQFQWFEGPCSSIGDELTGDCTALADSTLTDNPDFSACLASSGGGNDFMVHDVALQVTNLVGTNCADGQVLVSQDAPPETIVEPEIPFSPQPSPYGNKPEVMLAAFNGETFASYDIEGICTDDLEVGDCSWNIIDDGDMTIAPLNSCSGGTTECILPATVTVNLPSSEDSPSAPDAELVATDIQQGVDQLDFESDFRFESRLQPFTDDPGENDRPVCQSGVVEMNGSSTPIALSPDFCRDPDGDEIVGYELITNCSQIWGEEYAFPGGFCGYPAPSGSFNPAPVDDMLTNGALTYLGAAGVDDLFFIRAWDAEEESRIVAVRIDAIAPPAPDEEAPVVSVAFPAAQSYFENEFADGCTTTGVCGTASDNQSGVDSVSLTIQDGSGDYWNGASFAPGQTVLSATGTTSWSYAFDHIGTFTLKVWAEDVDGNDSSQAPSSPEMVTFTQAEDTTQPTVALTYPTATSYTGDEYDTASNSACSSSIGICGTAGDGESGLDRVTVTIKSGANYWNGSSFVPTETELSVSGDASWFYAFSPFGEGLTAGSYMVTAKSYDNEGNENSSSVTFTYAEPPDSTDPSIAISYPTSRTYTGSQFDDLSSCSSGIGICGTASDSGTGVSAVSLTIQNGSGQYWNGASFGAGPTPLTPSGTTEWFYAFSPDTADNYTVVATAEDNAVPPNDANASVGFTYEEEPEEEPCTFWRWIFGQCTFF